MASTSPAGPSNGRLRPAKPAGLRGGSRRLYGRLKYLIERQRSSPYAIAMGVSIGTFVTVLPTFGTHIVSAYLLAMLLRANRILAAALTAVAGCFVLPVYFMAWWLGSRLMGRHAERAAFDHLDWSITNWRAVWAFIWSNGEALFLGAVIIGLAAALALFPLVFFLTRSLQRARAARRRRRTVGA
jgi:uncharacterized protein (DUF2062 family)